MRPRLKAIVPRKLIFDPKRLSAAVEEALDDAAKAVREDFDKTVSTWDTYVPFLTLSRTGEREIYTKSLIYHFVNDGTKKHKITPKKAKALAFASLSGPKTQPHVINSGAGFSGGVLQFAKSVMHPGTKPRLFNKAIKTKWQKLLPKWLQEAINDAL
jgi:hypothetical protein